MKDYCAYIFTLLFASVFASQCLAEQEGKKEGVGAGLWQVTTHPAIELSPALSPDGKWVAFASKRSGNFDIWVRSIEGGRSFQITTHKSEDTNPVWSPGGDKIAFVSKRRDAEGDIWIVRVKKGKKVTSKGKPLQLTHYLGFDDHPTFSRDGRKIAFTSDRGGIKNIWIYDLGKKRAQQLTTKGGINPHWSPQGQWIAFASFRSGDDNRGDLFIIDVTEKTDQEAIEYEKTEDGAVQITSGPAMDGFPRWSPDGTRIAFTRFALDSNRDGEISPEDNPSIWTINLLAVSPLPEALKESLLSVVKKEHQQNEKIKYAKREFQVTTDAFYDFLPFWGRDSRIYFVSDRSGNFDVWSLPARGIIQQKESAERQLQFAQARYPLSRDESDEDQNTIKDRERLYQRILAFKRVLDYFPEDSNFFPWAEYEIGKSYQRLGYDEAAFQSFRNILQRYPQQRGVCSQAEIEMVGLRYGGDLQPSEQIAEYRKIIQDYPDQKVACARAQVLIADLYQEQGQESKAIAAYQRVLKEYGEISSCAAEARLKLADVLAASGAQHAVIEAYLAVVDAYPSAKRWVNVAIERIIALCATPSEISEKIKNYQRLIEDYGDYQQLAAKAQLKIGLLLKQEGDYHAALKELEKVQLHYPQQGAAVAKAKLQMADIYLKSGEDLEAIAIYQEILNNYSHLQKGRYGERARTLLLSTILRTATDLKNWGSYLLALGRYRAAREVDYRSLEAHRGIVECYYRMGEIDKAISEYQDSLRANPEDEISMYSLGLAYSYKGSRNKKSLQKSNALIRNALSRDYRLIYAYLTLGYNCEALEEIAIQERAQEKGLVRRVAETVIGPFVWIFRTVTFQKKGPQEAGYERAIEALTTAIALNDEKSHPRLEALLALNLGNNYYKLGEYNFEKAYRYYQKKLQCDSTFTGRLMQAIFYERIGHCGLVVEDFKKAADYLKQAIDLYRQLRREKHVVMNIERLALLYQQAGEHEQAIEYYRQALNYYRRKGDIKGVERAYRNIAYNCALLGDEEGVLQNGRKALSYLEGGAIEEIKPQKQYLRLQFFGLSIPIWNLGEIWNGRAGAGFTTAEEKALLYTLIAESYYRQKEFGQAIQYFQRKLQIYQNRDPLAAAIFLNKIGFYYAHLHQYKKAWEYFDKSFQVCKQKKLESGVFTNIINLGEIALMLSYQGDLKERTKEQQGEQTRTSEEKGPSKAGSIYFEDIVNYLETGLPGGGLTFVQEDSSRFTRQQVNIHNILGNLYFHRLMATKKALVAVTDAQFTHYIEGKFATLEDASLALQHYHEALKLAKRNRLKRQQVIVLKNLGELLAALKLPQQAYDRLIQARELALREEYFDPLWQIDHCLGNVLAQMDRKTLEKIRPRKTSVDYYAEAAELLESHPTKPERIELEVFQRRDRDILYENIISYLFQRGDKVQALHFLERAKAKRFLDIVSSRKIGFKEERHKILWDSTRSLQQRIHNLRNTIKSAESKQAGRSLLSRWQRRLHSLEEEYFVLLQEIETKEPELVPLLKVTTVLPPQIQNILNKGEAVLEYFVGEDETILWILDQSRFEMITIPVKRRELRQTVDAFRKAIVQKSARHLEISARLYDLLLKPAKQILQQKSQLVIIPDDCLFYLPFCALWDGETYVIDNYTLTMRPSLANYGFSSHRKELGRGEALLTGQEESRQRLTLISERMQTPIVLVGVQAIESTVKAKAPAVDYIHWEEDIIYDKLDPLQTALRFRADSQNDGSLQVAEIFTLNLRARILALASNHVDFSPGDRGDEIVALEGAFFYAGVSAIVASLWKVDEKALGEFFQHFYAHLQEMTALNAFRNAQRALKEKYGNPALWAAFQFVRFGKRGKK